MRLRRLGHSQSLISPIGLGTLTFAEDPQGRYMRGVGCEEAVAHRILSRAIERGITLIDLADTYGVAGYSEAVVGRWLKHSGARDRLFIATKAGLGPTGTPLPGGAARKHLVRSCDESLTRLGVDHVDLYQVHIQDPATPEEETIGALDDLVRAGKVRFIGASNYAAYRAVQSLWISEQKQLESICSLQLRYNLLSRGIEREHLPLAREFDIGVIVWGALADGFLAGKYKDGGFGPNCSRLMVWRSQFDRQFKENTKAWRVLECIARVSRALGVTPGQIAVAWLLSRHAVTSVLLGVRSVVQLDENIDAADLVLPEWAINELDHESSEDLGAPYDVLTAVHGKW